MTPKEIESLAGHRLVPPWVMKLAMDIAAAEREECAKVCEEVGPKDGALKLVTEGFAAAIRARGDK